MTACGHELEWMKMEAVATQLRDRKSEGFEIPRL
jgi:hypothetical protein